MKNQFRYKTSYSSAVFASTKLKEDLEISKASIEDLAQIVPDSISLEKNLDLVGTAFDAAVVNRFNKNDDGIDSSIAAEILPYFIHKPTNIEHNVKEVVGHIVNSSFTSKDNKILTLEEALASKDSYYISLAAVAYKHVNKDFAELLLEASDPEDEEYKTISASWELGFNDYVIAAGSEYLSQAEIITDKKHIKELSGYLKSNGGNGVLKDGTRIYRLIKGSVYPLGIGYTASPAADVEGVLALDSIDLRLLNKKNTEIGAKNNDIFSHIEKNNVKTINNKKIMELEELKKLFSEVLEEKLNGGKADQKAIASATEDIVKSIKEGNEAFVEKNKQAEKDKQEAIAKAEKAEKDLSDLKEQLASTSEELSQLKASVTEREALDIFNSRMGAIDDKFELSKEDRTFVAKHVKQLDTSEASFEEYSKELDVIFSHKSKDNIEKQKESFQEAVEKAVAEKLAKASEPKVEKPEEKEDKVEEDLEKAKASEEVTIPNNNQDSTETLKDRYTKAFNNETIKITY